MPVEGLRPLGRGCVFVVLKLVKIKGERISDSIMWDTWWKPEGVLEVLKTYRWN
jgi:hypothetical protein